MEWAIKVGEKYFKDFEYKANTNGRHGGHTALGSILDSNDITGLELTEQAERTMAAVEVSGKVKSLVDLMRYKDIKPMPITIEPLSERVR